MTRKVAQQRQRQTALGVSLPAPVGGWDALNPIAAMPPTHALILDNWIPRAGLVELRRGYVTQVTGFPAVVESMMSFRSGTADKLFAASNGKLYDVTTAGALGAAVLTGQTNNRYNYTGFANGAGNWLIAVNGADIPIGYNAGTWATLPALTGTVGSITIVPADLSNVFAHKGRLFYFQKNTMYVWSPAPAAVGGACTLLDLSSIFSKGGRLICGATWSGQLGLTSDDFAVFMTDQGQVAIYQGIDPTSATAWALLGVFDFGPPLGAKAFVRFGGDLAIATADGVIPLSQGLQLDRAQQFEIALTRNIMNAFSASAKAYGANYGWQGILYPGTAMSGSPTSSGGSLAIFNIPIVTLQSSVQYVQNVLTGAWCRLLNINAFCWEVANGGVYFGTTDGVYQWDQGASDNGVAIVGDLKPAFNAFGSLGRQKEFTMIRPIMNTIPIVKPALEIDVDYQESTPTAVPTVVQQGVATQSIRFDWTSSGNIGYVGAPRMQVNLLGYPTTSVLAVDGSNLLAINGSGDNLLIQSNLPFDVPCQLLGFDLMYRPGGQL